MENTLYMEGLDRCLEDKINSDGKSGRGKGEGGLKRVSWIEKPT